VESLEFTNCRPTLARGPMVGNSYRQQAIRETFDTIVIGSGIGGLAAAVLLARHGHQRVLVLERHYAVGGFTHVFHRPGFEWDVGVHYVGQMQEPDSPVRKIFDHLSEGRLTWAPMPDVYDRVIMAGRCYDYVTGVDRFRQQMTHYFPNEAHAIQRYLRLIRATVRWSGAYFAERALPPFLARWMGGLLRWPFMRYARRNTATVLGKLTENAELKGVLAAQWGDYGLPPSESSFAIHSIIAQHYFDGASYPVGGAGSIARALSPEIERCGGQIVVGAEVGSILTDARYGAIGVRMADGQEFRASAVISDAGARNTFGRLLRNDLPDVEAIAAQVQSIPPSTAHLCLYVGLNGSANDLGLSGTNLWIYPGPDHDDNVRRFLEDRQSPLPMIYISFPSAKDPTFIERFPGRATIEVICAVPFDLFSGWENSRWKKRPAEYEALKKQFAERMLEALYRHVPSVRGRVVHAELSTPLTTRHFSNYQTGEIYGLAHTPARFRLRCLGPRTPVPNLYLTGQDAAVVGVVGATAGGVLAASAVLKKNIFKVATSG